MASKMSAKQREQLEIIRSIGGYIVHKPNRGQIGQLFCGWDDSGEEYRFGYDFGAIFPDVAIAAELRDDLGEGWVVKDVSTITEEQFLKMRLLSAIYGDDFEEDEDPAWHVVHVAREDGTMV